MKSYQCPSCGAPVQFASPASVFMVCKYCHSTLVRRDLDLEFLGKMANLKDDVSPFQIGTSGFYQDHFTVMGRVRLDWADGFWNEWYVRFNNGKDGWLAEAQGFYMISLPALIDDIQPDKNSMRLGLSVSINRSKYDVKDVKVATYSFAEGELPFSFTAGQKVTSVDLSRTTPNAGSGNGPSEFASLSFDDEGHVDAFVGQYLDFEQFRFQNLRQIDGW